MKGAGAALIAVLLVCAPAPAPATAHVRTSAGYSEIRQEGSAVTYTLSLEAEILDAAAGTGAVEDYVIPRVQVFVDGVECDGALVSKGIEDRQGRKHTLLRLGYECHGSASGRYEVRYGVFADGGVVDDHTNVTEYSLGGEHDTFVFDAGHRELVTGQGGLRSSAERFVALGIEHILLGFDHVLFLVALLIGARSFKSVVKLATAFTAAHSVTLALAALGWVDVPAEIVEPLIALSIAYVAADTIVGRESRHKLGIVFGFGLLHGLGFASTLSFADDLDGRLLASLATFNVGIELGQALIVAALFPVLLAIRRFRWSPVAHAGAAAAAAGLGLLWFFERLMA
jgi:hydrogenase/urease accessory protein HupE